MATFTVIGDNYTETVVADKAYVDNNGTLRFYNTRTNSALAQFAPGKWERYKTQTCIACGHVRKD